MMVDSLDEDIQQAVLQQTLQQVALRENQDEATKDCCVICLDLITHPCNPLPCGHQNFDDPCISHWLAQDPRCPLCKALVPRAAQAFERTRDGCSSASSQPNNRQYSNSRPNFRGFQGTRFRRPHRDSIYSRGNRSMGPADTSNIINLRRQLYHDVRYSKHVGSNRLSCYRELTPQLFCDDSELVSRAKMFIRRELRIFAFLNNDEDLENSARGDGSHDSNDTVRRRANNAEFLLEYIIAILKSVDIMGSAGQAEDMLTNFLGRDPTKLFLHELRAWLRSPYTKLEDWDRAVQYDEAPSGSTRAAGTGNERKIWKLEGRADGERRLRGDYYRPTHSRPDKRRQRRVHNDEQ